MSKIVDLQSYRTKAEEQRCFGPWHQRFNEAYDARTKLADLSDTTLFHLSQPGENSTIAFYELIMGILDLRSAAKFHYLANRDQMIVVDIHLFLADHVRFEMMRRLQWLAPLPLGEYSLIKMVKDFENLKTMSKNNPPELVKSHPEHNAYQNQAAGDKEVFIRRMLSDALDEFKKRLEE